MMRTLWSVWGALVAVTLGAWFYRRHAERRIVIEAEGVLAWKP